MYSFYNIGSLIYKYILNNYNSNIKQEEEYDIEKGIEGYVIIINN